MKLFYTTLLLALVGIQTSFHAATMARVVSKAYGRSHTQLLGPRVRLVQPRMRLLLGGPIKPNTKTNNVENKAEIQRIAGKALIINAKNEVLMLREATTYADGTNIGKYLLPGGRINVGEKFFDGLQREVHEETGLKIVAGKPLHVSEWFPAIKGVRHQVVGIYFACKPVTTTVRLSSEHDHYVWVDPSNLGTINLTDSDRQALQKWKEAAGK